MVLRVRYDRKGPVKWYRRIWKRLVAALPPSVLEWWAAPVVLAVLAMLFYWTPLISRDASIHWDAADIHYPLQKYFADRALHQGIPFWTPYTLSGYPVLADPEMEAWYPPNWPLYLAHFRPRFIEVEIAFHAFLACFGTYLLLLRFGLHRGAALMGALFYGFSGYFAGHSSHVTLFATAAWFPWLLLAYRRAMERTGAGAIAVGAFAGGVMFLAGYPQAAMLAFAGLLCFATPELAAAERRVRALTTVAGMFVGAAALFAIVGLPLSELIGQAAVYPPAIGDGSLQLQSLLTLLYSDARGTLSLTDKGLITDHYYYAGLALLPLGAIGLLKGRRSWRVLALLLPAVWYMLGPAAGLYRLGEWIPGGQMMGPPDVAWFIAALVLAWMAATGSDWVFGRSKLLGIALVVFTFGDLWYCNMLGNPLPYERRSFAQAYGRREASLGDRLAASLLPLSRFDALTHPAGAGPALNALDLKFETTYGNFVLRPRSYVEYIAAMQRNEKLRDGLNVSRYYSAKTRQLEQNPTVLPRVYFPKTVADVADDGQSRAALAALDPSVRSTVIGAHPPIDQDPAASPFVTGFDEQSYRVRYTSKSPSLLKLSVAWFPGWRATLDGRELPVLRVDHAMLGVVAPAGDHQVEFRFHSNYFAIGAVVSVLALLTLTVLALRGSGIKSV